MQAAHARRSVCYMKLIVIGSLNMEDEHLRTYLQTKAVVRKMPAVFFHNFTALYDLMGQKLFS